MYDLIALALQTDSTRIATLEIGGDFEASAFELKSGYHTLSHHGMREESIKALIKMERYQLEQFARFLAKLKSIEDVTEKINAAVVHATNPAEAAKARQAAISAVEEESFTKTGLRSNVIALYQGGQYRTGWPAAHARGSAVAGLP